MFLWMVCVLVICIGTWVSEGVRVCCYDLHYISVHLLFVIYLVLRTRFLCTIPMYELL